MDLYDVDDENRQHIERHSQQIEEGEANDRRVHLISFRRTVVGSYNSTTIFQGFTRLSTDVAYFRVDSAIRDLWALCAPIFIIVVYSRTATSYFLGGKE